MLTRTKIGVCVMAFGLATGAAAGQPKSPETRTTLAPFASERDFERLLDAWRATAERERRERERRYGSLAPTTMPTPPAPPAPVAAAPTLDAVQVSGSPVADGEESITNTQTQGVDEGGIVKRQGDYLIVLRRGRLFTVRIGDDRLEPVSTVDAFAPDADPRGAWYDEMLVSDGTVVVIGFSYARGGTEIGVFDLDAQGGLRHRDTYHLRSNDYYSARNYASRLIGDRLVFYTPQRINAYAPDPDRFMPAMRRWRPDATPEDFRRILPATRIYRSPGELDPDEGVALHTVTQCDLGAPVLECRSTAVLGPGSRVFYVSEDAVYVWTAPWTADAPDRSTVFRLPLEGDAPTALRASGSPIDQMSFLQRDGHLNVLVGSESAGEAMWNSRGHAGALALLRVPLSAFGDGTAAAAADAYRALPDLDRNGFDLQNRFIGDWLVYGAAERWRDTQGPQHAHAVRYAGDAPVQTLRLAHDVERIDALGSDAVLVGMRGRDLQFTSVRLDERASAVSTYTQPDASQADARTHGFFYRPQADGSGIVGLPILGHDAGGTATASVLYLRNRELWLSRLGTLDARKGNTRDDACKASCVDWYGNARPIFIGDRVFALLGYELVEGVIDGERIDERRRIDFSPSAKIASP